MRSPSTLRRRRMASRAEREAARLAPGSDGSVLFTSAAGERSSRSTRGVASAWREARGGGSASMLPRAAARGISMWGAADGDGEDYDEEEHIDLADSAADAAFEDEDGTGTAHASPTHARAALAASDVEDDPAAAAGTSPRASARTLADDVYAYFESVGDAVDRCEGMLQFIGRAARADGKRDYGLKRAITEARVRWVHAHPLDDMLKRLCLCVYLLRQRGVVITLRTLPPKKEHAVHHARCKLPGARPSRGRSRRRCSRGWRSLAAHLQVGNAC